MAIKKIYIIFDSTKYTKDMIKEDMLEEGFRHFFKFDSDVEEAERIELMKDADEVWCFGDMQGNESHLMARLHGVEIWKMG